jgi:hypothetical protein
LNGNQDVGGAIDPGNFELNKVNREGSADTLVWARFDTEGGGYIDLHPMLASGTEHLCRSAGAEGGK